MAIATGVKQVMTGKSSSVIRKMFEEGLALKRKYGEERVFDFSLGNPDLDPPEQVLLAIEELAKDRSAGVHGYMSNAGYAFSREAMAQKTSAEQGVSVSGECVVMAVGAAGALNAIFKAVVNPGDEVVVSAPFFSEYEHYVANAGGRLHPAPTKDDFSLDLDAMGRALTEKTAAVLINSPNNPTGRVYTQDEVDALGKILRGHGTRTGRMPYLVADEPYRAITYGKTVAAVFTAYDAAIVATSFAKNFSLPGERIGYICVSPSCPDKDELVAAITFTTRTLGFVNAPAFFQRVVAKTWQAKVDYSRYAKRRDAIMAVMDEAGIRYCPPEGAFYLWCKAPDVFGGDDGSFADYLKCYNVLCAPGEGFGGKGWVRFAYCVAEKTIENSRQAIVKAMSDLEEKR